MRQQSSPWRVHKFGGTSLAHAAAISEVKDILNDASSHRNAVVVSALAGMTNRLVDVAIKAKNQDSSYLEDLDQIKADHLKVARDLGLRAEALSRFEQAFQDHWQKLGDVLKGVQIAQSLSEAVHELVSGSGEVWSARLLTELLHEHGHSAVMLNARDVLFVHKEDRQRFVDWERSQKALKNWLQENDQKQAFLIVTGFIASTTDGEPTTLLRNGSDHSAAIFAHMLEAESLTIWTDVSGVMSADPRKVDEAFVIEHLSYDEAMELSFFGAKVLHPQTMAPVVDLSIPIYIKNTFDPKAAGTCISRQGAAASETERAVKGFSTMDNVALVNVEGSGMLGVPGISERVFGALREAQVNVMMISQASSEHSICFVVPQSDAVAAQKVLNQAFYFEIDHGQIQSISVTDSCSVLAVVGDGMVKTPGVSAIFFSSLARAGVNVRAIAQGSSERNISIVVEEKDSVRALRAAHAGFYLSEQTLSVGLIGPGLIGKTLLSQLQKEVDRLNGHFHVDIRVRGIMNSKKMLLSTKQIDLSDWDKHFESEGQSADLEQFIDHICAEHIPHKVVIDCTSSQAMADSYREWMSRGIHVITPNKKANSSKYSYYQELQQERKARRTHYLYETTVGAGLPVISTLQDLLQTGDKVEKIEGVFSGTLAFIFNQYQGDKPFSQVVQEAKSLGYTEPDPRDDLSGMDVARKLIILAREMGVPIELEDIIIESLIPAPLSELASADEFMQRLGEFDSEMNERLQRAQAKDEVLRYVGVVDAQGKARVELRTYPKEHAFGGLRGSDNIIAYTTARYSSQPLIVRGPGAGPDVTAAGVFADLLRLSSYVGASL